MTLPLPDTLAAPVESPRCRRCHRVCRKGTTAGYGPECAAIVGLVVAGRSRLVVGSGPDLLDMINEGDDVTFLTHPGADHLIHKHGNTAEGRRKARDELAEAIRANGKHLIEANLTSAGRSAKCGGRHGYVPPRHAGDDDGCRNDGTSCVCECHDPKPA